MFKQVLISVSLRESTPGEGTQSHSNRDEYNTQSRIKEISNHHHANGLCNKSSAIEVPTYLGRGQPTLDLCPVS